MRILPLLVLFLSLQSVTAQSTPEHSLPYRNVLQVSTLKLIDIANPGIQVDYECLIASRYSLLATGTYLFADQNRDLDYKPQIKGYRAGLEARRYAMARDDHRFRTYLSVAVDYLSNSYRAPQSSAFDTLTGTIGPPSFYQIRKKITTYSLRTGVRLWFGRFTLDGYLGLGIRYKDVVAIDKGEVFEPSDITYDSVINEEGKRVTFSVPLNLKAGFLF